MDTNNDGKRGDRLSASRKRKEAAIDDLLAALREDNNGRVLVRVPAKCTTYYRAYDNFYVASGCGFNDFVTGHPRCCPLVVTAVWLLL